MQSASNDMTPLVSIIVPVYNVERTLDRCVNSLVNQTYSMVEIILVDDGSTDESSVICDKWAKADSRIRTIHKSNGGLSDARNAGLNACVGSYIAFTDSDDYVDHRFIATMLKAMQSQQTDLSVCSVVWEEENGIVNNAVPPLVEVSTILNIPQCLGLTYSNPNAVPVWNKLYRERIWKDLRFPKDKLHEDEFVFHKVLYQCDSVVVLPECLYHYVQHSGSIMHTKYDLRRLDRNDAWLDRLQAFINHDESMELINPLIRMMVENLYLCAQLDWHDRNNRSAVISHINALYSLLEPMQTHLNKNIWKQVGLLHNSPQRTICAMYWKRRIQEKLRKLNHGIVVKKRA